MCSSPLHTGCSTAHMCGVLGVRVRAQVFRGTRTLLVVGGRNRDQLCSVLPVKHLSMQAEMGLVTHVPPLPASAQVGLQAPAWSLNRAET